MQKQTVSSEAIEIPVSILNIGNFTNCDSKIKAKLDALDVMPDDLVEPVLTENALKILENRYLIKDDKLKPIETPKDMFWRVAKTIASNEIRYNPDVDLMWEAKEFYRMISTLEFLPNSPTMMNAGRPLGQLSACFVLPVEDSMEKIFETVKHQALVHKSGGGTGFSFSRLRPRNSMVASTAGTASGPVSFMAVFNAATEAIKQGGTRRGANMGMLRIDHPDVREFIKCKSDMVSITNFNISLAVSDAYMKALLKGENYDLIHPTDGSVVGQENALEIFELIAENAWKNGDPGMIFIDEINRHEKTPHIGLVEATNPCGEQPLLPYESCNLGSINLNKMMTEDYKIDWEKLRYTTKRSVRFLDNIIDMNKYPIEEIRAMTHANRRIGLGIMGFADMLYAMRMPYESEEALELGKEIMKFIHTEARQTSNELAVERGAFPNWEGSVFTEPTRNSTVTTIAPTGTISMIAETTGGIEPNFALYYVKRVMDDQRLVYSNEHFERSMREDGLYSEELLERIANRESFFHMEEYPEEIRNVFVTAHDITPEWQIRLQAAFQQHCDNAVSKTINLSNDATLQEVKDAYILAWKLNCKGITVYRDGSRETQVMNVGNKYANKGEGGESKATKSVDKQSARERQFYEKTAIQPRKRPKSTRGYTEQITTPDGQMYLTINEDEIGLCEVFIQIGKNGGTIAAMSEAIGRLVSLALRSGVDPHQIVSQLKGIVGPTVAWNENESIRSVPDGVAKALERYLKNREQIQGSLPFIVEDEEEAEVKSKEETENVVAPSNGHAAGHTHPKKGKVVYQSTSGAFCPDCNGDLIFTEGCMQCRSCGYSKCY